MKLLIFLLAAIVVISGCTVPGTDIEIPGIPDFFGGNTIKEKADIIIIKSLEVFPKEAAAGERVKVVAQIQNVGDKPYNIIVDGNNDYFAGKFLALKELKKEDRYATIKLFDYCAGLFAKPSTPITSSTIRPQEIKRFEWELTAQQPPVKTSCNLKVSVAYAVDTESATTITFINQNDYERKLQDRSFSTTSSTVSLGQGPVRTFLTVEDEQPIPAGSSAKIELQLKNEGSGFVLGVTGEKELTHFKKDNVIVTSPEEIVIDGDCFTKDKNRFNGALEKDRNLIRDKTTPLRCVIKLNGNSIKDLISETTYLMATKAFYLYELRDKVKVTVEPKRT